VIEIKKCEDCGLDLEKAEDKLCQICSENKLKLFIQKQKFRGGKTLIIPIFDLLARETANIILNIINNEDVSNIEINGRGRHISRAVDVLEILKREISFNIEVKTNTNEFVSKFGNKVKVSEIHISLGKKDGKEE